jgi:putative nucleotidyltransferase with HDIG domain
MEEIFIKKLMDLLGDRYNSELVVALKEGGFFTSPCSTQYHLSKEGGLLEHSLNVCDVAEVLANTLGFENSNSVMIAALLHDVGKMGQFGKPNYISNELKSGKISESKPYKSNSDLLYVPHEVRSVQIISKYIQLTEEESFAILQHNGMYGDLKYSLNGKETPIQMIVHFADMWASRVVEKDGKANE